MSLQLKMAQVIEDAVAQAASGRHNDGEKIDGNQYFSYSDALLRPEDYFYIEIFSFPQTWPSTALGFGGIGGQMISTAHTTVVVFQDNSGADIWSKAYVYFGGRLAYSAHPTNGDFIKDLQNCSFPSVTDKPDYAEAANVV